MEKDIFYCKPIKKKKDEKLWYCAVSLGHNTLDKKLKEIFALANLDPDGKSNHSLCATSISRTYYVNVPEKLIMERSGHLSKEGLRSYERTTTEQVQSICKTPVASLPEAEESPPCPEKLPELPGPSSGSLPCPKELPKLSGPSGSLPCPKELHGPTAAQPDTNDALKQLNFQGISGCTFTINVNYNK